VAQLVQHVDAAEPGADDDGVVVRAGAAAHGGVGVAQRGHGVPPSMDPPGRVQAPYHLAMRAISLSAAAVRPALKGKTCCCPPTTERVTATPASSARRASRVALSSRASSPPALTYRRGKPEKSA